MKHVVSIGFCFLLYGCGTTTFPYSHTAERTYPAKPENCNFRVLSTVPKGNYEEIGVLNIHWGDLGRPTTPNELKKIVHKDVCKAGGVVVVGEVNGCGVYVRGTLFRKQ